MTNILGSCSRRGLSYTLVHHWGGGRQSRCFGFAFWGSLSCRPSLYTVTVSNIDSGSLAHFYFTSGLVSTVSRLKYFALLPHHVHQLLLHRGPVRLYTVNVLCYSFMTKIIWQLLLETNLMRVLRRITRFTFRNITKRVKKQTNKTLCHAEKVFFLMKSNYTRFQLDDILECIVCVCVCACMSLMEMCLNLTSSPLAVYAQSLVCLVRSSVLFSACRRREETEEKEERDRN